VSSLRAEAARHRPALLGQVLLGLALFGLYVLVDSLASPGRTEAARRHGRQLLDL
jgi:diacylglycerol O-acyltransferase / wax synthase